MIPVKDDDGRVVFIVPEGRDITEKMAHELGRVLPGKNLELQGLAARAGRRRRAAAESANRAKDEFLAMLGHELRNPLAPIRHRAAADAAARRRRALERERAVIERQVDAPGRGWSTTCSTSRASRAARSSCRRERVELGRGRRARRSRWRARCSSSAHHTLSVDVPRARPAGGRRPGAARRRSSRTCSPTPRSTREPGGRITRRGAARRRRGRAVACATPASASTPEMLPRVFDLFVQERQALDRAQGGLGLGLTIVRSLVELHGGSVSARQRRPRHGAASSPSRLPRGRGAAQSPAAERAVAGRAVAQAAAGTRVLVVDDNDDAAEMLAEVAAAARARRARRRTTGRRRCAVAADAPAATSRCSTSACR